VGWEGQKWTTMESMRSRGFANKITKEENDLFSIITKPEFGIGQRAFLVRTSKGKKNVLWDCISYLDSKTLQIVSKLGGLSLIAISHPHYYSSMNEWSEKFGNIPIYIHELDKKWVAYRSKNIVFWKGITLSLSSEITLLNLGGHFDGGTVLHWKRNGSRRKENILLSGDIISVARDRRRTSFMYSYPNLIPLSKDKINQIVRRISRFRFEKLYSAFEGEEIKKDAFEAVKRSARRYIKHIS
jgi:glyoxylase-like metal-dependent hydrolase (beta-lactamase superfamily II)